MGTPHPWRGGPTPPPTREEPPPTKGERGRWDEGEESSPYPRGLRSLPLLKGRKSSLPLLKGGERSLTPPKREERRKGSRRGGARRADQKNRHGGPTRAGNYAC